MVYTMPAMSCEGHTNNVITFLICVDFDIQATYVFGNLAVMVTVQIVKREREL